MERTIEQLNLKAVHREATKNTTLHSILEALLYRRNEFLRNVTAGNLVDKLQATLFEVLVNRTNINDNVCKLTTTTGLLLVNLAEVNRLRNGLFVVNLRLTLITFYLKLTTKTIQDNIEVKLTHTGYNRLAALFFCMHSEGRILLSQLLQAH